MTTKWKEKTIRDLVESGEYEIRNNLREPLSSGQRSKRQGPYPYYGAASAIDNIDDYRFEGLHLLVAEDGTVTDGSGPMLQLVSGQFWVSNHAHILRGKNDDATKRLYYLLRNVNVGPYITGAVQPKLSKENLFRISFLYPENEADKVEVVAVPSALDAKIDLLKKQNETLEQIAQAIFNERFVKNVNLEKLPEGWTFRKVRDTAEITIGRTPPRKEKEWFSRSPTDRKWISIKDLGACGTYINSSSEYLTEEAIKRFRVPLIPKNTVVVSFKLTVGRVAITTEDMFSNEAIAHIKVNDLPVEYTYLYFKTFDYNRLGSTSSIGTATNSEAIKDMEILVPSKNSLNDFTELSRPFFQKILSNTSSIQTLVGIRDTLLPRLMSGELTVNI